MDYATFTSKEIGLLLQRARAVPQEAAPVSGAKVEAFDFQSAGHLSSSQIARLQGLHTGFAEHVGMALSSLLSLECKATAGSVEQTAFGDLARERPDAALFGMLKVDAPQGSVLLQADLATALPVIDLLLGGAGTAVETLRPLTEIEQEIFRPAADLFGAELQSVWTSFLETSLHFESHGPNPNVVPPSERVLGIKFDIQIGEIRGAWTVILPSLVSNAFIRKVEQQISIAENEGSQQAQRRLREKLLDSSFRLELYLPPSTVSVRKLARLQQGQVVVLKPRSTDPVDVNVAGINLFQATPVSCGEWRGAQIQNTLSVLERNEKGAR